MCVYCGHEAGDERHDPARQFWHRPLLARLPADDSFARPMTQAERALITKQFARADAWRAAHPEPHGWAARGRRV